MYCLFRYKRSPIELWSNIETFQRPFPGHGEPKGVFRQGDYRSLYMKLSEASPLVKRIITYEYFSCMSPNTEWGSSRRLLARYLEMIGKDTAIIDEIYHRRNLSPLKGLTVSVKALQEVMLC